MDKSKSLNIIIWQENKFYIAQSLEFGIASQGESYDEAMKNIKEAIELYLEEDNNARQEIQFLPQINQVKFDRINVNTLNINV